MRYVSLPEVCDNSTNLAWGDRRD